MTSPTIPRHWDRDVTHNGVRLSVRNYGGDGPPLLLLHGAGRSLADWEPMVPYLLDAHRVAALDLRGHGRSDDGPWGWRAVQDDCRAVIAELGYQRPAIVGHSLGGMLAAMLASSADACRAAVNLDGHGSLPPERYVGIDPETVTAYLAEQEGQVRQHLAAVRPLTTSEQIRRAEQAAISQAVAIGMPVELATSSWERSLAPLPDGGWITRPTAEIAGKLLTEVASLDLFEVYAACRSPLLIVNAHRPQAASPEDGPVVRLTRAHREGLDHMLQELACRHEHIHYQRVDATHGLIYEQPESLAALITSFVGEQAV